jgi:hypothetical protein
MYELIFIFGYKLKILINNCNLYPYLIFEKEFLFNSTQFLHVTFFKEQKLFY